MEDTVEISGEGAAKAAESQADEKEAVKEEEESTEEVPESVSEVTDLKTELKETKDRLLRQVAEFQNYKRRTEQEKTMLFEAGKAKVVQQMLEILDDFTRSVDAVKQLEEKEDQLQEGYEQLKQGVELVFDKFQNELARLGVEPIEAKGQPFNEQEHEALMQQPAPEDTEPGTVLEEIQKGYRMGDRVLRHTRVVVAA
ncbi:MAG: nucleotide exchange factor GrpE [Bacteroidota bacterium]